MGSSSPQGSQSPSQGGEQNLTSQMMDKTEVGSPGKKGLVTDPINTEQELPLEIQDTGA